MNKDRTKRKASDASDATRMPKRSANQRESRLRQLNLDLDSVHKTSTLLTGPMDLQQVLEVVVKTVAQTIGADAAGLRLLDQEKRELVLKATYGLSQAYIDKGPVTAGESLLNNSALDGQAIVVQDMRSDPQFVKYHDEIIEEGLISCLTIGLRYREKGIGILRLYSKQKRGFSQIDISTAQIVASQSAAAIINARLYAESLESERMARQVRLAGVVQRHLIPHKPPVIAGWQLAGIYVPCYDVGGDFYDFVEISPDRLLINMGDVMGKGIPASLVMASLRSSLRAYAAQFEDLTRMVSRANRMFCHDAEVGEFATLFCALIDIQAGILTYCNCGHEPPLLIRDGKVIELAQGGTVIGLSPETDYVSTTIQLRPDDMIVMFTDGLADAFNFQHESFGRKRIVQAALDSAQMPAEQAAKNILWLMRKFAGLTTRYDDTALVVLKRTP